MPRGKYKGYTLPEILVKDPNYFFWLAEAPDWPVAIATEAKLLHWRATHIKLPKKKGKKQAAEYVRSGKEFGKLRVVPRGALKKSTPSAVERGKFIDLSVPRKYDSYDKDGSKRLVHTMWELLVDEFDDHGLIIAERAEQFFADPKNFARKKKGGATGASKKRNT